MNDYRIRVRKQDMKVLAAHLKEQGIDIGSQGRKIGWAVAWAVSKWLKLDDRPQAAYVVKRHESTLPVSGRKTQVVRISKKAHDALESLAATRALIHQDDTRRGQGSLATAFACVVDYVTDGANIFSRATPASNSKHSPDTSLTDDLLIAIWEEQRTILAELRAIRAEMKRTEPERIDQDWLDRAYGKAYAKAKESLQ